MERRAWVLDRMEEDGYLTPGEAKKLAKSRLRIAKGPEDHWSKAPYFVAAVLGDLFRKFEMHGMPRNGLRVYTTLDSRLQRVAEQNLEVQLTHIEKTVPPASIRQDRLEGAMVILDPETGGILAMQGGRRFAESQFNRTAGAVRPIGSLLHPFLIAGALERGLSPLSPIPVERVGRPALIPAKVPLSPSLADLLLDGEQKEWNLLAPILGYGSVSDVLRRVGLVGESLRAFDPSRDVQSTPLRVGLSYATLINGGYTVSAHIVQRVEDRHGHLLFEPMRSWGREKQVFDPKIAYVTRELMAVSPYSQLPSDLQKDLPQTTSTFGHSVDGRDVWYVGLVPSAVSVLWLGSEHGRLALDVTADGAKNLSTSFWRHAAIGLQGSRASSQRHFVPPPGVSYVRKPNSQGQGINIPMLAGTESSAGDARL
jgi:membrane peptidoglycan carboxypeptidase